MFYEPHTPTIIEVTTGPLMTHQRAVLSFISQQLQHNRYINTN